MNRSPFRRPTARTSVGSTPGRSCRSSSVVSPAASISSTSSTVKPSSRCEPFSAPPPPPVLFPFRLLSRISVEPAAPPRAGRGAGAEGGGGGGGGGGGRRKGRQPPTR